MDVRGLGPEEWRLKRRLRLAALLESPAAFGSSHAREAGWGEAAWGVWPDPGELFAAFDGDVPVGIAAAWAGGDDPRVTHLISMWVDPAVRGRGVAGELVAAVVGWAARRGSAVVVLEVAAGNAAAAGAYVRAGFRVVDRVPHTAGGTVYERVLGDAQ